MRITLRCGAERYARPTPASGYATVFCFRQKNILHNFNDSLNNNKIMNVIMAEMVFGFLKIYFKGQVMKKTDGDIIVIRRFLPSELMGLICING
jgi:hypothetical protein